MASVHGALQQSLVEGDLRRLRRIDRHMSPHLDELSVEDSEICMHMARTVSETCPFKHRAYSHRWLSERELPSQLPDRLKPQAERIYPRVVDAVGISCSTGKEWLKPALVEVRGSMEYAVEECFADNERDPAVVKGRMMEARVKTMKQLFGGSKHG